MKLSCKSFRQIKAQTFLLINSIDQKVLRRWFYKAGRRNTARQSRVQVLRADAAKRACGQKRKRKRLLYATFNVWCDNFTFSTSFSLRLHYSIHLWTGKLACPSCTLWCTLPSQATACQNRKAFCLHRLDWARAFEHCHSWRSTRWCRKTR